ncbi:MAG: hypothetical protein WC242_01645 [Candidatus Paceibacterota bacterium]|jgi:hypothetical protein
MRPEYSIKSNFESEQPENPRLKELESRRESLTEEEKAELMGLRIFPDDPRGAELCKKEALGLINEEERRELNRLRQLKTRKEKFSPEVQRLFEKTEANDPDVEEVRMNNGKLIEVLSSDEKEKTILTFGLIGCYGVVLFTEHEDGTRDCILTHYDPTNLLENTHKLTELIARAEKMKTAKKKHSLLIMEEGNWQQDPQTGKYEMQPEEGSKADRLETAILAELGSDVQIKIEPYSTKVEETIENWGVLTVRVPPAGKGDATYETWFSGGKF